MSAVAELERTVDGVPDDWREVAVADVVAMLPGFAFKSENFVTDTDEGLPLIRIRDLGQTATVTRYVGGYNEAFVVQDGDILVGMDGEFAAVRWQGGKALLNQRVLKLSTAQPGVLDEGYLFYRVQPSLSELEQTIGGTTVKHLSTKDLKRLTWQLPPLDEQRRIAEVLRSVDDAIAANRAALDQVKRARAAILHSAFEETVWEPVALGELGSWQSGGTPSKDDDSKWGGDVPWVCPRDMKTPVIKQTHSTLTPLALGGSCKLAPKGTLMIVVRGMILAKAIPTATTAMEATLNQDMKAFRPNGRALPKFVQLCLQHQERQLLRVVNTATHGTKKLDTDTLLAVSVPLPDLETQQALADAVSDLDFASVKYGEEHIRLSTIKQALMSDLLSGRVRVPA